LIFRQNGVTGWRRNRPIVGKPDFVFPKAKVAVFVDGCFWHGCPKCYRAPKSNVPYWRLKIERNRKRDLKVNRELRKRGWVVLRFWECRLQDGPKVSLRIQRTLAKLWTVTTENPLLDTMI
jgi:DNA mismatch endonuclease (patch repair protein)